MTLFPNLRTTAEAKAQPDEMPPGVRYRLHNVLADAKSAAPAELEALLHKPKKANMVLGGGRVEALSECVIRRDAEAVWNDREVLFRWSGHRCYRPPCVIFTWNESSAGPETRRLGRPGKQGSAPRSVTASTNH
jgi:hypothetical protein